VLHGIGWWKVPDRPLSGRFAGSVLWNPLKAADWRALLDSSGDVHLSKTLSVRASAIFTHDTVVGAGVQPTDLRATVGLAWTTPPR
jgi:hypothetical protein